MVLGAALVSPVLTAIYAVGDHGGGANGGGGPYNRPADGSTAGDTSSSNWHPSTSVFGELGRRCAHGVVVKGIEVSLGRVIDDDLLGVREQRTDVVPQSVDGRDDQT